MPRLVPTRSFSNSLIDNAMSSACIICHKRKVGDWLMALTLAFLAETLLTLVGAVRSGDPQSLHQLPKVRCGVQVHDSPELHTPRD